MEVVGAAVGAAATGASAGAFGVGLNGSGDAAGAAEPQLGGVPTPSSCPAWLQAGFAGWTPALAAALPSSMLVANACTDIAAVQGGTLRAGKERKPSERKMLRLGLRGYEVWALRLRRMD